MDSGGRALVTVEIGSNEAAAISTVQVWIDTGFTGDLVLPQKVVNDLGLPQSGTVGAILADGSQVALKTYTCVIKWFGGLHNLEVVANEGDYPLLGVGLLLDCDLRIDYRSATIVLQ